MAVDGVSSSTGSSSSSGSSSTRTVNKDLDKNAFLQLLATQMQYQDPLNPQDNTQYMSQLAQYSSLEQMTNLNTAMSGVSTQLNSLASIVDTFGGASLHLQVASLIGKTVTGKDTAGKAVDGVVDSVVKASDGYYAMVGDQKILVGAIDSISQ